MYKLPKQNIESKQQKVVQKAQKFGHTLLYSEYEAQLVLYESLSQVERENFRFVSVRVAILYLRCPHHNNGRIQKTTVCNYLRARTGLLCCGRKVVSKKLQNRVFSEDTRQKMAKAKTKPRKPASEKRELRHRIAGWRREFFEKYGTNCAFCVNNSKELNVHHLYIQRVFSSLKFDPENGIVLSKEIHEAFHAEYGHL